MNTIWIFNLILGLIIARKGAASCQPGFSLHEFVYIIIFLAKGYFIYEFWTRVSGNQTQCIYFLSKQATIIGTLADMILIVILYVLASYIKKEKLINEIKFRLNLL
jgi:hypothetical protein